MVGTQCAWQYLSPMCDGRMTTVTYNGETFDICEGHKARLP